MTLIEAIKSNKPIRLPDWAEGYYIFDILESGHVHTYYAWLDDKELRDFPRDFSKQEILSDLWEVKND